jgi:starch synthase
MNPSASDILALSQTQAASATDGLAVAHVLRKYNPAEWGGTETAVHRLLLGLTTQGVRSVVYCPRLDNNFFPADPLRETGSPVKRFRSFLPVMGLSREERQQHIGIGGNIMSLDLPFSLWREPGLSVIHTHALGRLGAVAGLAAQARGLPLAVTIHGGYLDLPPALQNAFGQPKHGWEWGRIFGALLRSRKLLHRADAILTCNPKEAALLRKHIPDRRVIVQPHGISTNLFARDERERALEAFPLIRGRELLLSVGRIDSVKNQRWLVEQMPELFRRHPQSILVLAGACTDENYGRALEEKIRGLGLQDRILLTGGLPPGDARLIGLLQAARVLVLPSLSETFGLVILESWAAGTPVIASRTSGAQALIGEGENGWLFDHGDGRGFHQAVDAALSQPELAAQYAATGRRLAITEYDTAALAGRMRNLYAQLVEEKNALRHSARR